MVVVRQLRPQEWPRYRTLRLTALQDSPDAFASTWESSRARPDADWAAFVAGAQASDGERLLVAEVAGAFVGLLWCRRAPHDPALASLYQMWVAPTSRGQGVGRALLRDALDWARAAGVQRVGLDVTVADSAAWRLYLGLGFRPHAAPAPLRDGSALLAQSMELRLRPE